MGWFRSCFALLNKNRLVKSRQWCSTLAELLLPVLVFCIFVGLREAVSKDTRAANQHLGDFITWNSQAVELAIATGSAKDNEGTSGVQTIQFVGLKSNTKIDEAMNAFKSEHPALSPLVEHRFESDEALEDYVTGESYATSAENPSVYMAISFISTGGPPERVWDYAIRGNASQDLNEASTLYTDQGLVNRLQTQYDTLPALVLGLRGHLLLQNFVDKWIIETQSGTPRQLQRSYGYQPFPTPSYVRDVFADTISGFIGLFFTIIYIWPVTRLVKGIVEEKQLRIREGMRMMGLPDSALFCSWLTTYSLIFLITSLGITLVTAFNVYVNSNKFYIFIFFFFFAMTTFSFCWLLAVFFSRAQVATTVAALAFLGLFFIYFAVQGRSTSRGAKVITCLIPQVCFSLGAVVMAKLESAGTGVTSSSVGTDVDNFNYNTVIGMFILDFFLYLLLALYFQQIVPSEWGTHQRPWFCCLPRYWCPKAIDTTKRGAGGRGAGGVFGKSSAAAGPDSINAEMANIPHRSLKEQDPLVGGSGDQSNNRASFFEPVSAAVAQDLSVSIQHLRRTFKTDGQPEPFVAVKDLSLDLYSGQILALLGHNGAGKTTVINMMTGMIAPTSGDALIFGSSIRENMSSVRKILGVCPQHNILFDLLTVKEHLELFAAIKDVPREQTEAAVQEMISQVGLTEKVNDKSAALSGGMQRKLSVGIALLGDSKIIFLDEPTSGMDPYSRRATWDLLKKKKEGRVIILTTHFMDEADQLGDRIAIMAKGDVKCCGSSLFLKGRYGVGYTLTLTKADNFQQNRVHELITTDIPDVTPLSNIAGEISYRLPFQSSAHFADVFDHFDEKQAELGIASYGISVTTLEEVFLRVGHEEDATPAEVAKLKRQLAERANTLSHEHDKLGTCPSASPPVDVADMPDIQPKVVVIHTSPDVASEKGGNGVATATNGEHRHVHGNSDPSEEKSSSPELEGGHKANRSPGGSLIHVLPAASNGAAAHDASLTDVPLNGLNDVVATQGHVKSAAPMPVPPLAASTGGTASAASATDTASSDAAFDAVHQDKVKRLSRKGSSRFAGLTIPGKEVSMFWPHFRALFIKRWLTAKRDRKVWTWTLLYPFLILLAGIGLVQLINTTSYPRLAINSAALEQGGTNFVPVANIPAPDPATNVPVNLFAASTYAGTQFEALSPSAVVLPSGFSNTTAVAAPLNKYLFDQIVPEAKQAFSRYNAFAHTTTQDNPAGIIDTFIIHFNTSAQFASTLGLNIYNSQLLTTLQPTSGGIRLSINPLPRTRNQQTLTTSITAVIVSIGFAFMPANFISFAVKEEQDKVKHQQLISGVSALSYWGANYAWDFCNYMVMGLLCLLIFKIWSIDQLIGPNTGGTFLAIVLFGLAVIPFNYLCSFLFTSPTAAQNSMLLFYIFTGALLLIALIVLSIIESTKNAAYYLKFIMRLIPSYAFGEAIAAIVVRKSPTAFGEQKELFDIEVLGYPCIFLACEIVVYSLFVLIWEKIRATPSLSAKLFGNPDVAAADEPDEDADVIAEKARLQSGGGASDAIKVMGLRKVYKGRLGGGNKIAVQNLWMGIPEGQCFGFLGINGAGKTTTLKMLTGDIIPGSGTATLRNLDILTHQNDVRRLLGYCPQFDALSDFLTAREHLTLFARIKGVPEDILPEYVEHLILRLGLQEGIADKPTKGYSGGNKRKLCVGIALIGNPPIVFLDEPSTGMDPGSRRFMWDLIAATMKHRSVILTTHSMEECEALCHRIGIMVGGRLRCLGSTTHLKQVYGNGYQLDVNVASGAVQDAFKTELANTWPEMQVIESHGDSLKFRLPREVKGQRTTIGQVFRFMEEAKQKFGIREYACSETSLEQIFIHFARSQAEETGQVAGLHN